MFLVFMLVKTGKKQLPLRLFCVVCFDLVYYREQFFHFLIGFILLAMRAFQIIYERDFLCLLHFISSGQSNNVFLWYLLCLLHEPCIRCRNENLDYKTHK